MGRAMLTRWAMALTAAALVCSCGRDSEPRSNRAAHHPAAPALAPGEADLVSAVSPAGSAGPVGLKFRVPEPPRVGQPLQLELVLAQEPALEISHILVSLQAGDGLLLESDRSIEFEVPPPGASHRMLVTLRAQQEGLLSLNATVLVDAGNTSLTRSFSIPLIAER
jgi:hypothetical protein